MALAGNLVMATPAVLPESSTPASPVEEIQKTDPACTSKACVKALIEFYADMYGVDRKVALKVAECESEFKTTATGDSGKAYGVFQFHKPTFKEFAKEFGDESLEYKNTEHAIELAVWALAQGKGYHWTCYRNLPAKVLATK